MATSEGYEASNEYKGMVLHDGPAFNFNTYEVFKAAEFDANKIPGCKRVMYKKVPVDESAEDRLARMEEDREANAQIIAMFCRDGRNNLTAISVITAHARKDKDLNANILFSMLKERFTQKAKQRLQALYVQFNGLEVKSAINELPIKFWDRYTDILTAIGNIDEE